MVLDIAGRIISTIIVTVLIMKSSSILNQYFFFQVLTESHNDFSFIHKPSDVYRVKIVHISQLLCTIFKQKLNQFCVALESSPVQWGHIQLWRYVVDISAPFDESLYTQLALHPRVG